MFTLLYEPDASGARTAAVHSDVGGALAQAVHDLQLPGQRSPDLLLTGDHGVEHSQYDGAKLAQHTLLELGDIREAPSCGCELCERHRRHPEHLAWLEKTAAERIISPQEMAAVAAERETRRQQAAWAANHSRFLTIPELRALSPEDRATAIAEGRLPPIAGGGVPGAGYRITWTAVALSSGTAKTIAGFAAGANTPGDIVQYVFGADLTTGNILLEVVFGTNATNAPGTNSTAFTELQVRGPAQSATVSAGVTWTAEPTVLTVVGRWRIPFPGGPLTVDSPLGREINSVIATSTSGKFVGVRATASAAVTNADGHLEIEE